MHDGNTKFTRQLFKQSKVEIFYQVNLSNPYWHGDGNGYYGNDGDNDNDWIVTMTMAMIATMTMTTMTMNIKLKPDKINY